MTSQTYPEAVWVWPSTSSTLHTTQETAVKTAWLRCTMDRDAWISLSHFPLHLDDNFLFDTPRYRESNGELSMDADQNNVSQCEAHGRPSPTQKLPKGPRDRRPKIRPWYIRSVRTSKVWIYGSPAQQRLLPQRIPS